MQPPPACSSRWPAQLQQHQPPLALLQPPPPPPPRRCRQQVCRVSKRRDPDAPIVKKDFEVPQVGWMWDAGAGSSGKGAAATRSSLKSARIKAKKSLGQNFCTDDAVLADIVAAARVAPGDAVIEVGPGTGNLTRHLLATRARVLAVEKDDTLVERLREELQQADNLQLLHGDIMRLDLQALVAGLAATTQQQQQHPPQQQQQPQQVQEHGTAAGSSSSSSDDPRPLSQQATAAGTAEPQQQQQQQQQQPLAPPPRTRVKVVANLPYNITKEFLLALLPQGGVVSELSIMIQEDAARRLADPTPGRPDYRAMSVITHYYSRPVYRFKIPKEKYFPVPGVDGALVTFKLRPPSRRQPLAGGEAGFRALVAKAFSERRKMMRNNLQPLYSPKQVEEALVSAGVRPDARAQDLDVAQFAAVYNHLCEAPSPAQQA